ncbi:MAG: MotE family protein [Rhizobiaceae bacterium]|jgi:flagellar motility protein MotE (MotC chaperone)
MALLPPPEADEGIPVHTPRSTCVVRITFAALALCLVALPALAGPAETPPATPGGDEIERFCTNIADAARDRRYALQRQQLLDLQADIDKRVALLEKKRAEYEDWLKRRDDFLAKATDGVVEIYAKMKPDGAAPQLTDMPPQLAAAILMKLDPRQSSLILGEMDAKAAANLTRIMAAAARKTDPS